MPGIYSPDAPVELPRIIVQTRRGRDIENWQTAYLASWQKAAVETCIRDYSGPGTSFRTNPIPVYNCHGLTFASRRTSIPPTCIDAILKDDRYERVQPEDTLPGDVILYYSDEGEIEHSGIVIEVPVRPFPPRILSKWGMGPEVIHPASFCPYEPRDLRYYRVRT